MMDKQRMPHCHECLKPLESRLNGQRFCGPVCRKSWNNRRATRGACLYDVFMGLRHERKAAKLLGFWSLACAMATAWKREDREAGRQSYNDPAEANRMNAQYRAKHFYIR